MPVDQDQELQEVRAKSPFWGVVWIAGDIAYYLGILAAVVVPMGASWVWVQPIDSLLKVGQCVGVALLLFLPAALLCFAAGFAATIVCKGLACRITGVRRSNAANDK